MCRRCATSSATSRRSKPSCSRLAAPYVAAMSHVAAPPLAMLHVAAPPLAMLHVACNVSRCMRCRRRAEWRGVGWSGVAACCSPCARSLATPDAQRRCGTPTLHEQTSCAACFAQEPRDCARACAVSWHSSTETNPHPSVPGRCGAGSRHWRNARMAAGPRLSCARLPWRPALVGVQTEAR